MRFVWRMRETILMRPDPRLDPSRAPSVHESRLTVTIRSPRGPAHGSDGPLLLHCRGVAQLG
ncbi:hypothetical protein FFA01_12400 [Frigoribacterium faeni]|uniref:Uncharacterized protein n=1 Tax=Frigoribacterium faeni TaxID=145483 RepID=A0ABQ0UN62_9MICO|nr:hypothetical protein FFA01_12400 [Frigoribacterium faeni]